MCLLQHGLENVPLTTCIQKVGELYNILAPHFVAFWNMMSHGKHHEQGCEISRHVWKEQNVSKIKTLNYMEVQ
jgi:hypothetical protein